MNEPVAIAARDVGKTFGSGSGRVTALDTVSLDVSRNEFFTLLGPSGCGKTTLLRLIAGFEFPTTGEIHLDGRNIAALPPFERPVNTVFQNYALFPHMSVAENIGFGLAMQKRPADEIERRVGEVLELVRMESLRHRAISDISGGQQQRVALARALAPSPAVLLLDEPLSALDYKLRKEMQIELKRMQGDTGITFIFVTHDQEEALSMSDRIAVMSAGRILQVGTPHDIYERPADRFVASFIGESNFLQGELVDVEDSRARVKLDDGGDVQVSLPPGPAISRMPRRLTLVVRPEHATLTDDSGNATLQGRLEHIVYSGTDTQYHVRTGQGTFVVRAQNRPGSDVAWRVSARIGIRIADHAAQVLAD